jgi:regulatory protein
MPLITALDPAPGRLGGLLLEVDGSTRFRVSEDLCRSRGLHVEATLTILELEALAQEAGDSEAMDRAVHYLSYRPRTCMEVRRHLARNGLTRHADAAIVRCVELGYLNDDAYAQGFVRERISLKPRGRPRLVSELLARGVDRGIAEEAVDVALAEEGVTEAALLRAAALRRMRALRDLDPPAARRRLAAFLARRGFPGAAIRDLVRELFPDESDAGTL